MPRFKSSNKTSLDSGSRKRNSMVMDCVVLDEDSNEMNENNQNLDEEDEEDLNYAANLKIAKRMSMHQSSVAGPSTTIRDKQLIRKQTIAHRIDQICEYAQVLMHCLLYKTNYYDRKIHFDKYIKYDIVVYKCKSEIVCEYITNCIESMRLILYSQFNLDNSSEMIDENRCVFSIGLAVLKSASIVEANVKRNLLIKRFTLQIENLAIGRLDSQGSSEDEEKAVEGWDEDNESCNIDFKQEWQFRDSLLKCLYSEDAHYPANFKWQIQMRTTTNKMCELSHKEDLFKLFAWRNCDVTEIRSVENRRIIENEDTDQNVSGMGVKPIKTIENQSKTVNLLMQLFVEQPLVGMNRARDQSIKPTQQLARTRKLLRRRSNSGSRKSDQSL